MNQHYIEFGTSGAAIYARPPGLHHSTSDKSGQKLHFSAAC
jgi:hypothetical protein